MSSQQTIYVANLRPRTTRGDLSAIFSKYGKILKVDLKIMFKGATPIAFIRFETSRMARAAIEAAERDKGGYKMDVRMAKHNKPANETFLQKNLPKRPPLRPIVKKEKLEKAEFDEANDARIYIGDLPPDIQASEISDLFNIYGDIVSLILRNKTSPISALVTYKDVKEANKAISKLDGYFLNGHEISVELQRERFFEVFEEKRRRMHGFSCEITGLPPTVEWDELKDFVRRKTNVRFVEVFSDFTACAAFNNTIDLHNAINVLDRTTFRPIKGESSTIRVKLFKPYLRTNLPLPQRRNLYEIKKEKVEYNE